MGDGNHRYRKHPAHRPPIQQHNRSTILFVTVNTRQKRPLLASEQVHAALIDAWKQADHWVIGYYVILPDHLHLFCAPGVLHSVRIDDWCQYWKRMVSKACPELNGNWQNDCWDTQMRNGEHFARKLEYAVTNPVAKGLVKSPKHWPYQGNIVPLEWCGD